MAEPYEPITDEHINEFLGFLRSEAPETTFNNRKSCLKRFNQYIRQNDIDVLNPPDNIVYDYVEDLRSCSRDYGDIHLGQMVTAVSKLYDRLEQKGKVEEDPTQGWTWAESDFDVDPNTTQQEKEIKRRRDIDGQTAVRLYPDDVEKMVEHAPSPKIRHQLLIRLMFQTTLRPREVKRILIPNIDFSDRTILIESAKADEGDDLVTRTVFYTEELDELLRDWLEQRRGYKHADSDHLFITQNKPYMRPTYVSRQIKESAKKAGINEKQNNGRWLITGQTMRHASISHLVNDTNLELDIVRELAGHKSIETTKGYIQTSEEEKRKKTQKALR